jgi:hypothetical protein
MQEKSPTNFNFNIEENPPIVPPDTINIPNFPQARAGPFFAQERVKRLRKLLKIIKWSIFPLIFMQLLFILPEAYPLIVIMPLPIIGLIAARRYDNTLLKLFAVFLIELIGIQVINMIILQGTIYVIIQCLFIIVELAIAIVSFKATKVMASLTQEEWISLKE